MMRNKNNVSYWSMIMKMTAQKLQIDDNAIEYMN